MVGENVLPQIDFVRPEDLAQGGPQIFRAHYRPASTLDELKLWATFGSLVAVALRGLRLQPVKPRHAGPVQNTLSAISGRLRGAHHPRIG